MFTAKNKVRMHDTDMAGVLYFPRLFRFAHDAWEDLMEKEDLNFTHLFNESPFTFLIVHCEANFFLQLQVGQKIETHVEIEKIGNTSFTISYKMFRGQELVGNAKTVHVTLERTTRKKMNIPLELKEKLQRYLPDASLRT